MNERQDVLGPLDLDVAARREWRLEDGLGGGSAGTIAGAPTQRTQSLLLTATPHGRLHAPLTRCEERLHLPTGPVELNASFAASGARPGALDALERFRDTPWPSWRWRFGPHVLERDILTIAGHAGVVIRWRLVSGEPVRLVVTPLLVARDAWGLQRECADFRGAVQGVPGRVRCETAGDAPGLTLWYDGAFLPARAWRRALVLPLDGAAPEPLPALAEDAFAPGYLDATLAVDRPLHLVASTEEQLFRALASEGRLGAPPARSLAACVEALAAGTRAAAEGTRDRAIVGADTTARQAAAAHGGDMESLARRREPLVDASDAWVPALGALVLRAPRLRAGRVGAQAAGMFAPERGDETLRLVPALIALQAFDDARAVLRGAIDFLDEGLAPESFDPIDGTPRYGDPSPSLWLAVGVDLLARRGSRDFGVIVDPFIRDVAWPALEGVLQHLRSGSRHGVHADRDGVLWAGEGGQASARADVNALWWHALVAMAQVAKLVGRRENAAFYLAWAHELQRHYVEQFWDATAGCLFVARTTRGPVRGLTASQLWAISLPPALLPVAAGRRLLATLERELLAPGGLLDAPDAPRASAAWLGPWAAARTRLIGRDAATQRGIAARFEQWRASGPRDPDGTPRLMATPLEAAEVVRAWVEDLDPARLGSDARVVVSG